MESSSPLEDNRLGPTVCAPLAQHRINLTFLTHVAGDREVICTAGNVGEAALTLLQAQADPQARLALQPGTSILAVYPHDKRPEVIGTLHPQPGPGPGGDPRPGQFPLRHLGGAVVQENQARGGTVVRGLSLPGLCLAPGIFFRPAPAPGICGKGGSHLPGENHQGLLDHSPTGPGLLGHEHCHRRYPGRLCRRFDGDEPANPDHSVFYGPAGARRQGVYLGILHRPALNPAKARSGAS